MLPAIVKDGGVAGHPAETVLFDQSVEYAACNQAAADVVQPHELVTLVQCEEWIHEGSLSELGTTRTKRVARFSSHGLRLILRLVCQQMSRSTATFVP